MGVAGGIDYCALTAAAIGNATAAGGVCAACAAATGAAAGCAAVCPDCINALDAWLASCANNFDVLNYATLEAYTGRLVAGADARREAVDKGPIPVGTEDLRSFSKFLKTTEDGLGAIAKSL